VTRFRPCLASLSLSLTVPGRGAARETVLTARQRLPALRSSLTETVAAVDTRSESAPWRVSLTADTTGAAARVAAGTLPGAAATVGLGVAAGVGVAVAVGVGVGPAPATRVNVAVTKVSLSTSTVHVLA